uniref:VWFD domain-containing protein n=1 Tax=Esox lucius TaxID=8010 RepID=A0A3P8Z1Q4_ESOLU
RRTIMTHQWVKLWISLLYGLSAAYSDSGNKIYVMICSVCSTWGNYHYKTYDGDFFQLPYTCNYVLTSLCKSRSGYEEFNIQLQREEVDGQATIKKISLKLDGTFFNIFMERTNSYVKITAKLGLVIMWNKYDGLSVELDSKFQNQTCGLCGDFNGVQLYDEFIVNGKQNQNRS